MPNHHTTTHLLSSHHIENLFSGIIIENGYPRTDLMFKTKLDKADFKKQLHLSQDKKVILYAPTYRGEFSDPTDENNTIEMLLDQLIVKYSHEYNVLYKGHYFKNTSFKELNIIHISNHIDSNELLSIVDILITDYSSIAFDFLVMKKPILYYV